VRCGGGSSIASACSPPTARAPPLQVSTVLPHLCGEVAYRQGFCCNQTLDTVSMSLRQEFW
jgi:hypothetical protein